MCEVASGLTPRDAGMAEGDITNWHTLMVQMTTFKMCHDFVILFILKKKDDLTFACYFPIVYLYKQTMNQTKYLVTLLLTFNNQQKSIYVPKRIGHFSPLMLHATSNMPSQHLLVKCC